jgi:dihydroneopterin aldolase
MRLAVVKLGGSTAQAAEMNTWIDALAASGLPLVIVPGGGPFADQVRDAQQRLGFSDKAAHAMAILAMEQFGHVILDRHQGLSAASSPDEARQMLARGQKPVWLPSSMAIGATDIPASWDIPSDSLAAWLAGKLDAWALLLIKQTNAFSGADDMHGLAAKGVVDAAFGTMLPDGVELHLAGPRDAASAHADLAAGRLPGRRIRLPANQMRRTAGR